MRRFVSIAMVLVAVLPPVAGRMAFAQSPGATGVTSPGIVPLTPAPTRPGELTPLNTAPPLPVRPNFAPPITAAPAQPPVRSGMDKPFTPAVASPPAVMPALSESIPPPPAVAPSLAVEMVGPEIANIGLPVAYELVVHNTGKGPAANVRVENELPAGFNYLGGEPKVDVPGERLGWNLGVMEPGAERRIKVVVKSLTEGELRSRATVTFSSTCSLATRFTRPKLTVTVTGPETALVGEAVAFQIRIANVGSGPIQKVMIRDTLPGGLQHPQGNQIEADLGSLAAGESRTVTLKTTAAQVGSHLNKIVAYADSSIAANGIQLAGGPRNPDLESTAKAEVRVLEPGLQVRMSGPKTCLVKCEAVYSIDLTNPGSAPSRNVRVVNRLPEGVEFVAASEDGVYDPTTRTVSWVFPGQEPAAHKVLTIKTRGVAISESAIVVMAQADGALSAKAELPVAVEGIPAISLEVSDPDDPAPVGADAMYEIRVLNQGTCPCTGIQIIAVMPDGMEVREVAAPTPYKVLGQQVQFAPFARLATKADLVYRIKVRSSKPGDVRFKVQLTCDQLQQPVTKEESSRFYKP